MKEYLCVFSASIVHRNPLLTRFLAALVCLTLIGAGETKRHPNYPKEILGYWELGEQTCINQNPDSDGRLVIDRHTMWGYEQKHTPLFVLQISRSPRAWKVKSIHHIYEDRFISYDVIALSSKSKLTIINDEGVNIYSRCPNQ